MRKLLDYKCGKRDWPGYVDARINKLVLQIMDIDGYACYSIRKSEYNSCDPIILCGYDTFYNVSYTIITIDTWDPPGASFHGLYEDETRNNNRMYATSAKTNIIDKFIKERIYCIKCVKKLDDMRARCFKNELYFSYTIPRKFLKPGILMFMNSIGKPKIYNIKRIAS
jgi:hypothetical protein